MPVDFRQSSITIPAGIGRRTIPASVSFGSPVLRASVALNGFALDFAGNGVDHHINVVEADTDLVSINGNRVNFQIQCQYADKNFDDSYSGYVTALVIAEVA